MIKKSNGYISFRREKFYETVEMPKEEFEDIFPTRHIGERFELDGDETMYFIDMLGEISTFDSFMYATHDFLDRNGFSKFKNTYSDTEIDDTYDVKILSSTSKGNTVIIDIEYNLDGSIHTD